RFRRQYGKLAFDVSDYFSFCSHAICDSEYKKQSAQDVPSLYHVSLAALSSEPRAKQAGNKVKESRGSSRRSMFPRQIRQSSATCVLTAATNAPDATSRRTASMCG